MALARDDRWMTDAQGNALSGARVYWCTQPASTATEPPSPLATVYTDSTGSTPITQPVLTDGFGHAYAYLDDSAVYTVVVWHPLLGSNPVVLPDQAVASAVTPGEYVPYYMLNAAFASSSIDASAYIQSVLNLAATAAGATNQGQLVVIPAAHFYCLSTLQIPQGVNISGVGSESIIDFSQTSTLPGLFAVGTTYTQLRNFQIIGGGEGTPPTNVAGPPTLANIAGIGTGITFAGVAFGLIEDVIVSGFGGITGVAPYNGVGGIWLTYGCSRCDVVRAYVTNSGRGGILQDNYFMAAPNSNRILDCKVENGCFGISDDSSSTAVDTIIAHNRVYNMGQSGIDLNGSTWCTVEDNFVTTCGSIANNSGITLYGHGSTPCQYVKIVNNTVKLCYGNGIKVAVDCYEFSVIGNHCVSNAEHGIYIGGDSRQFDVSHNICLLNTLDGMYLVSSGENLVSIGTVGSNTLFSNGQNGLEVSGANQVSFDANTITGNSTSSNGTYDGIRLENGTSLCTFSNNVSTGTTQHLALAVNDSESTPNIFSGNYLSSNGVSGRVTFAALVQTWTGNGDEYISSAGVPTGNFPYGTKIFNAGDGNLYILDPAGWQIVQSYPFFQVATQDVLTVVLSDDTNLTAASRTWQMLDPGTGNRNVNLYAPASTDLVEFWIKNIGAGGNSLVVKNVASTTLATLTTTQSVHLKWDGANWQSVV